MVDINFNRLKEAKNDNEVYEIFKEERSKYFDNLKGEKGAQGRYFANQIEKLISVYNDYYDKYPVPIIYWDGEERQDDSMFQALNCLTSDFVFSHTSIDLDPIHIMAYLEPFSFLIDPQSEHYNYGADQLHSTLLCITKFRKALEEKNGNKVESEISKSVEEKDGSNLESTESLQPHQKKTRKRKTNSYLHDERALEVYRRAIEAGYMKEAESGQGYVWEKRVGLCAYMVERLCVVKAADPMPYEEAKCMFDGINIKGAKQSYEQNKETSKPRGYEDIDNLFEGL